MEPRGCKRWQAVANRGKRLAPPARILVFDYDANSDRAARSLSGLPYEPDRGAEDRASAERSPLSRQASTCAGPVFVRRVLIDCLMTASATSSPAKATPPYAIVVIQSPRPVR